MSEADDRINELKTCGYSPDDTGEPNPDVEWLVAELERTRAVLGRPAQAVQGFVDRQIDGDQILRQRARRMNAEEQAILDFFAAGNGDMLCDVCHGYISTCARDAIEHLRTHRAEAAAAEPAPPRVFDKKYVFDVKGIKAHGTFNRWQFSDLEDYPNNYPYVPPLDHYPAPVLRVAFSELETRARAIEAIENPPSPLIHCPPCQGTGGVMEGPHLGALCRVCKGSGSIPRERLPQFSHAARPGRFSCEQPAVQSIPRSDAECAAERIVARAKREELSKAKWHDSREILGEP